MAKGTEEEKQLKTRSLSESSVRKIFGDTLKRVVKDKTTMTAIIAADGQGIKNIALSGGDYATIQKAAIDAYLKYIDKKITDKRLVANLKNNKKMIAEMTELVTTDCEANDSTVDSIVAGYSK